MRCENSGKKGKGLCCSQPSAPGQRLSAPLFLVGVSWLGETGLLPHYALGQSRQKKKKAGREAFFRMTKLEFQKWSKVIPSGDFAIIKKLFLWVLFMKQSRAARLGKFQSNAKNT